MNYIAHIHLADQTNTSLLGNFLGDFVKGDKLNALPEELKRGVQLHRKVDVFTDTHKDILELKKCFPDAIRKVAGIVLDIYFDFLLMTHWEQYSHKESSHLFKEFYIELTQHDLSLNERYAFVRRGLLEYNWLANYEDDSHCLAALLSVEKRFNGRLTFAHDANTFLQNNNLQIECAFLRFYPQLLDYAKVTSRQLKG